MLDTFTFSLTNFKNNVTHCLQQTAEFGKAMGKHIVTFDRSKEIYNKYGDSNEAQLKGRHRMITCELAKVALGVLVLAACTYGCVMHQGGSYVMTGLAGFGTLVALKEVAIQSIARQQEQKRFQIEKETWDTQYSFEELADECKQELQNSIDSFISDCKEALEKVSKKFN